MAKFPLTIMGGIACLLSQFAATAAKAEDCRLKQIAAIDFTLGEDGKILVPVLVNDQPFNFSVSANDAFTKISARVVQELNLSRHRLPGYSVTSDGEKLESQVFAAVQIGPLKNSKIAMLPQNSLKEDGRLGLDVLSGQDMEIDFAKKKLNFFQQDHCAGNVVYWAKEFAALKYRTELTGMMHAAMTLDGAPVDVELSLLRERSFITSARAKRLLNLKIDPATMKRLPDEDGLPVYQYPFKSLAADGITVQNPAIDIFQTPDVEDCGGKPRFDRIPVYAPQCYGGFDIAIGQSILQRLHLFFAFREHVLYFTAADARD